MTAQARRIDRLVAGLAPVVDTELEGAAGQADARELLSEILATQVVEAAPPRRRPRRILAGTVGLASLAAIVLGLFLATSPRAPSAAAAVLHQAALIAKAQPNRPLRPGEFVYTKSINAYLNTSVEANGVSYSWLAPHVREIWLGPTGGRLYETTGRPSFLSARDRATWVSLGRPKLTEPPSENALPPTRPLDLPTDVGALFARLKHDAAGHGSGLYSEMFVLVGDNLRESTLTPAQRASLFEVAARIPGVELVGRVKDSVGRTGVAVAMRTDDGTGRQTLVVDPRTADLLAEEDVVLAGNSSGNPPVSYPPGTRIGYSTYLTTGIVRSLRARPRDAN